MCVCVRVWVYVGQGSNTHSPYAGHLYAKHGPCLRYVQSNKPPHVESLPPGCSLSYINGNLASLAPTVTQCVNCRLVNKVNTLEKVKLKIFCAHFSLTLTLICSSQHATQGIKIIQVLCQWIQVHAIFANYCYRHTYVCACVCVYEWDTYLYGLLANVLNSTILWALICTWRPATAHVTVSNRIESRQVFSPDDFLPSSVTLSTWELYPQLTRFILNLSLPDTYPSNILCTSCGSWSINNGICCGKVMYIYSY